MASGPTLPRALGTVRSLSRAGAEAAKRESPASSGERTAAGAPPPLDYSLVAVPRSPTVTDGAWKQADAELVEAASREASAAEPVSGLPASLLGMSLGDLSALAVADGQPAFRGKQLHEALYSKARYPHSLDDFSVLPAAWKASLRARGVGVGRSTVHAAAVSSDGTAKLLLRLADGRVVETVGIPTEDATKKRLTVCVSSQVGCPMRCLFCATGKGGFARNLAAHEIVDQVLHVEERFGRRASHVVFMGMGEPLLNLRGVLAAHRALNEDVGISQRSMTISTVGVPNTLARLAAVGLQSTLAVSLHAPDQELREKIIPSAKAYPLHALMTDIAAYNKATGRRISFEYTLLDGVNDSPQQARALCSLLGRYGLGGSGGHVNLIPYNPVADSPYARPSGNAVRRFADALKAAGCIASVRQTRGTDAAAACGQLRNAFQSKAGPLAPVDAWDAQQA